MRRADSFKQYLELSQILVDGWWQDLLHIKRKAVQLAEAKSRAVELPQAKQTVI